MLDAFGVGFQNFHFQLHITGGRIHDQHSPWPEPTARLAQGLPNTGFDSAQQQQFHSALGVLAPPVQSSRNHPALVEHHQVAGTQQVQDVRELVMTGLAGGPVHGQ